MINTATLDRLATLAARATPAPWFVTDTNDDGFMSGVAVVTELPDYDNNPMFRDFVPEKTVAACLVQEPPYVNLADHKWQENAEFIAAVRNDIAELVRLARIGLAVEAR